MMNLPRSRQPENARAPAVAAVTAFATGIVLDRTADPAFATWLIAAVGIAIVSAACLRSGRYALAAAAILLLWLCLGGVRHHMSWSLRLENDIATVATTAGSPARLVGRLLTPLAIDPADHTSASPPWTQIDRTLALIECEQAGDAERLAPVSGVARLQVSGHLIGAQVGDRLELYGRLYRPLGPRNPGAFDYGRYLRSQGIDAILNVEHPAHVRVITSSPTALDRFRQLRDDLRRESESLFVQYLDPAHVPLAVSLLLGDRSGIDEDIAQAFAESGTMHLLAISGLNVGILAGLAHLVCRLARTGPRATMLILLSVVVGYAVITDQRPPVVRAALLAVFVLAGGELKRTASGYQALALCAMAILLFRPTDLFDPGAQLSFLAVLAIVWSNRRIEASPHRQASGGAPDLQTRIKPWRNALRQAYVITATIWVFTLPLTMWHFNLCSPVGVFVNVLLVPLGTVMLAAGYGMLVLGLAHPLLGAAPAAVFGVMLDGLLWLVDASAATPFGHHFGPAPPGWWLAGFYLLLTFAAGLAPSPLRVGLTWRAIAAWTAAGLAVGLRPASSDEFRATFLSVGHGVSVLLETPDGRTVLYDAGCFANGRRAQETVQSALWSRGLSRIDAAIVSHADVDHFNGLPGLLATVPVGSLLISPSCLDFEQSAVVDLCEAAAMHGVPIRLVQEGDRLDLGQELLVQILHPPFGFRSDEDNANSIVLRVDYRGRSLLLTGDLEGEGLACVAATPTLPVDVLMAPHHGAADANPPSLRDWASPSVVIASTGDRDTADTLETCYGPETRVMTTFDSGAVTVRVDAVGTLSIQPFVADEAE